MVAANDRRSGTRFGAATAVAIVAVALVAAAAWRSSELGRSILLALVARAVAWVLLAAAVRTARLGRWAAWLGVTLSLGLLFVAVTGPEALRARRVAWDE